MYNKRVKVLFICTGNICRSPMAEIIFANLCKKNGRTDIIVKSAGTHAHEGEIMAPYTNVALDKCGEKVPSEPVRVTQWRDEMFYEYDHVVCMTGWHESVILARAAMQKTKRRIKAKIYTLDSVAGCGDIADPWCYPLPIYIEVCKVLQNALGMLYDEISGGNNAGHHNRKRPPRV